ncbi:MAG: hypothetical protein HY341_01630 [Candidatus Kerfeldbacteria bacterium]|nr:hypothetical protein [Candidatus Kerfeldbacteria bacterium]
MATSPALRQIQVSANWAYFIIFVTALISAGIIYWAWTETPSAYGF